MSDLKKLREEIGLRRDFVASKLNIVPDHLSAIERGATILNVLQVAKLAEIYNKPFEEVAKKALKTARREY